MNTVSHRMLIGTVCLSAGTVVAAQGTPAQRYPLGAESITRALHNDGLDVHAEDVRLPMTLSSAVSDPALEVVGADRLPDGHLRLRLRCRHIGECLPFSVTLTHGIVSQGVLTAAVAAPVLPSTGGSGSVTPAHAATASAAVPVAAVSVRAGAHLTMLMEEGHMHIHLPVISLDNAVQDGQIHVATLDRKHTYRATVVNEATVRGIME